MQLLNYIRKLRFDKDETTQEALANAVGVSRQTIYFIEKGKVMPSILLAYRIALFFDKTVDEVFYIKQEKEIS
jgi:putative transcriptional regulator